MLGTGADAQTILPQFSSAARAKIDVRPYYENADLPSLLAEREVVLFLSRSEGFGLTLIEAMACGLAPVATAVGIAPVAVRAGENGHFVGIDAGDDVAEVVKMLSRDRDALFALRRAAQRTAREYDWQRAGRATLQAYSDALSLSLGGLRSSAVTQARP